MGIHESWNGHSVAALPKNPNPGWKCCWFYHVSGEKDMILQSVECSQNVCKLGGDVATCVHRIFWEASSFLKHTHLLSSFCDCIFYCETKQGDFPFLTSHRRWFPVSAELDRQALEAVPKFGTSCLEISLRWLHGARLCISRGCKILHDVAWICFSGDVFTENPMVNHPKKKHTHTQNLKEYFLSHFVFPQASCLAFPDFHSQ